MLTKYLILRPGKPAQTVEIDMPREPDYLDLKKVVGSIIPKFEHVSVLHDFTGGANYVPTDMFVDEDGVAKDLPRNEAATTIYRRAAMRRDPLQWPESLSYIYGPALVFSRLVWF